MNTLQQSSLFALLATILLSVSACSDKVGADKVGHNIDKSTESGKRAAR